MPRSPGPVIGGVFGLLCAVIAMNGFRVVRSSPLRERNMLAVGLPVLFALFATAFGAVGAILLHQTLPDRREG